MVLQGEGGKEAGEAGDEATEDGGETDGLPPAVGDGEGGEEEGDGDWETAQHTCREHSREAGQSVRYIKSVSKNVGHRKRNKRN